MIDVWKTFYLLILQGLNYLDFHYLFCFHKGFLYVCKELHASTQSSYKELRFALLSRFLIIDTLPNKEPLLERSK